MKTKKFDSVKMMREIRKKLTKEFGGLSSQEKIALLEKEFPHIQAKKRPKVLISPKSRL